VIHHAALNRKVRDFCRNTHKKHIRSLEILEPKRGKHDGYGIVYLVGRDGQTVFEVSCEYDLETWALAAVNNPFRNVAALNDGLTLDRVDLGETASIEAFLNEAQQARLWKGKPSRDSWNAL
jgi:hypothetical protein